MFARQLRQKRTAANLTATDVAERLREVGIDVNRRVIEAIERGDRQVRLDEAIACAAVLQVPFGVMIFGLGELDEVGLTPEPITHPDMWQQWMEGVDSAPGIPFTRPPFWKKQMQPVWMYQHLREQQERSRKLRMKVDAARLAGDRSALARPIEEYLAVCQEMAQTVADMKAAGVRPPAFYAEFVEDVAQLKRELADGER